MTRSKIRSWCYSRYEIERLFLDALVQTYQRRMYNQYAPITTEVLDLVHYIPGVYVSLPG